MSLLPFRDRRFAGEDAGPRLASGQIADIVRTQQAENVAETFLDQLQAGKLEDIRPEVPGLQVEISGLEINLSQFVDEEDLRRRLKEDWDNVLDDELIQAVVQA